MIFLVAVYINYENLASSWLLRTKYKRKLAQVKLLIDKILIIGKYLHFGPVKRIHVDVACDSLG
jgi:hypothetical protein